MVWQVRSTTSRDQPTWFRVSFITRFHSTKQGLHICRLLVTNRANCGCLVWSWARQLLATHQAGLQSLMLSQGRRFGQMTQTRFKGELQGQWGCHPSGQCRLLSSMLSVQYCCLGLGLTRIRWEGVSSGSLGAWGRFWILGASSQTTLGARTISTMYSPSGSCCMSRLVVFTLGPIGLYHKSHGWPSIRPTWKCSAFFQR